MVHGDLTTSNLIFFNEKIYMIDFGLAFFRK
ncbi:MAG: RIO1 family regulatory kinase/ATPase [Methanolobus sp.]